MRKRGEYADIAAMIPKVCQFAVQKGVQIQGRPTFVCHEMGAEEAMKADKEGTADVEVAVPVSGRVEGSDEVSCYELAGGKMAKTVHKGPYQDCGPIYENLFAWLAENGKEIAGPTREVYLNDPNEVPQAEILTDMYVPIE
ncbi:MAG: GyrI-like domain-containing protein [Chloroflexi bacterium]|nr:GyrI-like domain-containing protein [Chloroflexota bacterium]